MKKFLVISLSAAIAAIGLAPNASAGTLLVSDSVFKASKAEQVHPTEISGSVFVPVRLTDAQICVYYTNTTKKANQGQIKTDVTVLHREGDVTRLKLNGKVKNNEFIQCRKAPTLRPGDGVTFETSFADMPRLRRRNKGADDMAHIAGFVSSDITLEDVFPEPEPAPPTECTDPKPDPKPNPDPNPDPNPTPDPDPDPDPTPGPLSAADQNAASALLIQSKKTQLWRFKANNPKRWTVIGPKTQLGSGPGGVNTKTVGYGDTLAAAVTDYERKMGNLPAGGGLSQRDQQALLWYQNMNSAGGPTSIRRDTAGGYHGEYYRPGRGSVHKAGFSSIAQVVDWFKAQGL